MADRDVVSVRMFGMLRDLRREQGLPATVEVTVVPEGLSAEDVALGLGLPVDRIEGVFCNHVIHGLEHRIHPGDTIAFVPYGTPGPHRFFLGLYKAGHDKS
jgi:hypothetical protein